MQQDLNLLTDKTFEEETKPRQLYLWIIGGGRVVIIFTELIALFVWLARFRLDFEITTLQELVEEKAGLVSTANRFQDNYLHYARKIETLKKVEEMRIPYHETLKKLPHLTPAGLTFTHLSLTPSRIAIQAKATSSTAFAQFIGTLIAEKGISAVTLSHAQYQPGDQSYVLSVDLSLSQEWLP